MPPIDMTEPCKNCGKRSEPDRMIIQGEGYLCVNCYSGDVQERQEEIRKTGQWDSGREEGAGPVFEPQQQVVLEPFSFGASTSGPTTAGPATKPCKKCGKRSEPDRMIIQGEGYLCVNCYSGDAQELREEIRKKGLMDPEREEGSELVNDPQSTSDPAKGDAAKDPGRASTDESFPLAGWIAGMAGLLGFFVRFSIMRSTTVNGDTDTFYRDYGAITAGVIALVFGVIAAAQIMNSRTKKNFGIALIFIFLGIIHLIRGFVAF